MRFLLSVCLIISACSCATPSNGRAEQDLSGYTTAQLQEIHRQVGADYAASIAGNRQGTTSTSLSSIDSFTVGSQDSNNVQRLNSLKAERRRIENELLRRHEAGDTEARYW